MLVAGIARDGGVALLVAVRANWYHVCESRTPFYFSLSQARFLAKWCVQGMIAAGFHCGMHACHWLSLRYACLLQATYACLPADYALNHVPCITLGVASWLSYGYGCENSY